MTELDDFCKFGFGSHTERATLADRSRWRILSVMPVYGNCKRKKRLKGGKHGTPMVLIG